MIQPINESTREELLALTPSGDLMDLARHLREQGLESLLLCRPSGQIRQVVTDRQIAQLASPESAAARQFSVPQQDGTSQRASIESAVVSQTRRPNDDLVASEISRRGTSRKPAQR